MKQTIRFDTFETNSSSAHNIVIIPEEQWDKWLSNELFYLQYDFGYYNKKLLELNNNSRYFTKEFLENCSLFEEADKIPLKKDYQDVEKYEQALNEWCEDLDFIIFNRWDEKELEEDITEYITPKGEKLRILCKYGFDG